MEHMLNTAVIRGILADPPEYSHENHDKKFYRFYLKVPRLSGTIDLLPVIAEESKLEELEPEEGEELIVTGQVRSHNIYTESARHLLIFVFANDISAEPGEPVNEVELNGILCREPVIRRTPLGRQICDMMLAVPRTFHRADYLPCILWGRTAEMASQCRTRDEIHLKGRLQSRIYTKLTENGSEQRTAYEISAMEAGTTE